MVYKGGDDLEENFALDSSNSDSGSDIYGVDGLVENADVTEKDDDDVDCEANIEQHTPSAKKQKLNWRESATAACTDVSSQRTLLFSCITAADKYFPNQTPVLTRDIVDKLDFLDTSSLSEGGERCLDTLLGLLTDAQSYMPVQCREKKGLRVILLTASSSRAMYLVRELKSAKKVAAVPLFFHGGGRKKEQSSSQVSMLKQEKSEVAIALPSRLVSLFDDGTLNISDVGLVVIDLKTNEKGVNVLSQKDTMLDSLRIIGEYIGKQTESRPRLVLI